jgi:pyruvate,water dikinase
VSGEVTPDRWVVGKLTGEITVRDISDKHIRQSPKEGGGIEDVALPADQRMAPCLSDEELLRLKDIARKTEKHYGRAQDIEWAIDDAGKIFLLQSRPETVWSAKDAAPVARPQDDPKKHVMNIFGGRRGS